MRKRLTVVLLASALPLASCGLHGPAFGDANSIIVGALTSVWNEIEDSLFLSLEPSITTTVASEEIFQITHHDPTDSMWVNLRRFRQLLIVGKATDSWIRTALDAAESEPSPGEIVRVADVWARGQMVTVVVLPESGDTDVLLALLPELRDSYLESYRAWALRRMFASGLDTALVDTLFRTAGFSLRLPNVYRWNREGSAFIFRNDNPDPSQLIRQFTVTWTDEPTADLTSAEMVSWRDELAESLYDPGQISNTELLSTRRLLIASRESRRVQAVWTNAPEADWPAAGNFIVQSVRCPEQDRLYLIDAWLYAPGRDKYEYLLQLETVLDSFRCAATTGA